MNARLHRESPLTRSEIARVALEVVDSIGVEKFSMRRLAEALGVTTMAVYHHFENKAEILQAAADQVWLEVAAQIQQHDDPIENLVQSMLVIRRVFMSHPDVTPFALASPGAEDAVHVAALSVVHMFERAGFRGEDVARAYHVTATYTLGSAVLFAERTVLDRAIRAPVSDLQLMAPEDISVPERSREAYVAVREAMGADPDLSRFERGLRDIIAGLLDRYPTR